VLRAGFHTGFLLEGGQSIMPVGGLGYTPVWSCYAC